MKKVTLFLLAGVFMVSMFAAQGMAVNTKCAKHGVCGKASAKCCTVKCKTDQSCQHCTSGKTCGKNVPAIK